MTNNFRKWLVLLGGLIFFVADRLIKNIFAAGLCHSKIPFLKYWPNHNLALGLPLLPGTRLFFYFFLCLIILIVAGLFLRSYQRREILLTAAFWFILLGALSNALDRFKYNAVIDFIDLGFWPVFNLADVMIIFGLGLLCYNLFYCQKVIK
ncbi:MAG TPA: signal peptidase II [Patescibacteria group bacterium]|nr:signal peptidase II [Patescibacteria group bacterium]